MKKKVTKDTIIVKLTCYPETDKIICERRWGYKGELNDVDFDEFAGMVDEGINGDNWGNDEMYDVEFTFTKEGETLSSIIPILSKPSKLLYNINVLDTLQDIRDMLYGKDVRERFANNSHLFNE